MSVIGIIDGLRSGGTIVRAGTSLTGELRMAATGFSFDLKDVGTDSNSPEQDLKGLVNVSESGVQICFTGFGDNQSKPGRGCPVYIENRDGVPFLIVWGDINAEEPTHVIDLSGASESKRTVIIEIRRRDESRYRSVAPGVLKTVVELAAGEGTLEGRVGVLTARTRKTRVFESSEIDLVLDLDGENGWADFVRSVGVLVAG